MKKIKKIWKCKKCGARFKCIGRAVEKPRRCIECDSNDFE